MSPRETTRRTGEEGTTTSFWMEVGTGRRGPRTTTPRMPRAGSRPPPGGGSRRRG
ncbi:unnamed protein product [Gulo gulo]|uniref:Uncharacterized protein n=1 Tax=Gulo gulo TaxID=48420 RepID=A0A9X9Q2I7_GULGU|nr:unnamed protein product [Gulo gulo]